MCPPSKILKEHCWGFYPVSSGCCTTAGINQCLRSPAFFHCIPWVLFTMVLVHQKLSCNMLVKKLPSVSYTKPDHDEPCCHTELKSWNWLGRSSDLVKNWAEIGKKVVLLPPRAWFPSPCQWDARQLKLVQFYPQHLKLFSLLLNAEAVYYSSAKLERLSMSSTLEVDGGNIIGPEGTILPSSAQHIGTALVLCLQHWTKKVHLLEPAILGMANVQGKRQITLVEDHTLVCVTHVGGKKKHFIRVYAELGAQRV